MRHRRPISVMCVIALLVCFWPATTSACPLCPQAGRSLAEQMNESDIAVIARWVSATDSETKSDTEQADKTTLEVVQVLKLSKADETEIAIGRQITLDGLEPAQPGDLFFCSHAEQPDIGWETPIKINRAAVEYIVNMPAATLPTAERLLYFLNFLESDDEVLANDAYSEFAVAPYEDVVKIAQKFPRDKIRKWILSPATNPMRLGLYGLMLGQCGDKQDIAMMKKIIVAPVEVEEIRIGVDGLIFGYLILAKEEGLKTVVETKFKNQQTPFSETHSAMQALRMLWTYHPAIPKPQMREAMRSLLDRPEYVELVIPDLARWQDWEAQTQLLTLYQSGNDPGSSFNRREIIRFMIHSARFEPTETEPEPAPHVVEARQFLDDLKRSDPGLVESVQQDRF